MLLVNLAWGSVMLLVPDDSELLFLDSLTVDGVLLNAVLHCYVSNYTPLDSDDVSVYNAIEASFGGYSPQTIVDWSASISVGGKAQTTAGIYTFTATGSSLPQSIYGIYVTSLAGDLLYAEKIPTGPITLSAAGMSFNYQPRFTGASE